jgi:hypothetical protein
MGRLCRLLVRRERGGAGRRQASFAREAGGGARDLQWAELTVFGQIGDGECEVIARKLDMVAGFTDLR